MAYTGRKEAFALWVEATRGTKKTPDVFFPRSSGIVKPMFEHIENTDAWGVIDELYDTEVSREWSQAEPNLTVGVDTIGYILGGLFGKDTVSGAWPYTHTFARENNNNHQSFTMRGSNPNTTRFSTGAMIDSFTLTAEVGNYAQASMTIIGKKSATDTAPSISYSDETLLRARDCKVYIADTEWGLGTADPIGTTRVSLTIEKNLFVHQTNGEVDIDRLYNQNFTARGDMDLLFEDDTYLDIASGSEKKRLRIELINPTGELTGSANPSLSFTFARVGIVDWDQSDNIDEMVTQTFGFTATVNRDEGYTVTSELVNSVSVDYA